MFMVIFVEIFCRKRGNGIYGCLISIMNFSLLNATDNSLIPKVDFSIRMSPESSRFEKVIERLTGPLLVLMFSTIRPLTDVWNSKV